MLHYCLFSDTHRLFSWYVVDVPMYVRFMNRFTQLKLKKITLSREIIKNKEIPDTINMHLIR